MGRLWIALVCVALAACGRPTATTGPAATPAPLSSSRTIGPSAQQPVLSLPPGLPSLDPPSTLIVLPPGFAPRASYVSPDGRFVAARAKDYSRVVLYRVIWPSPRATQVELDAVAEVSGYADQIAWLEDSSGVLVGTDLDPSASIERHDPSRAGRRVAILNTDGRVVIAPPEAHSILHHRAGMSPDGGWIRVSDRCCSQQALLLSRDGLEVRTVIPPLPGGMTLGFTGWDRDGALLCWESDGTRSTLVAVGVDGVERYRIAAPRELGGVGWGIDLHAPDRSWQLVELAGGMGSDLHAYRLLVGRELRSVPDALGMKARGRFVRGNEIVYVDGDTGVLRQYDPLSGNVRDLPLTLDLWDATLVGVVDRYFVWMKLIHGRVTDLDTGRTAPLPLSSPPNVSAVDGGRLAEYLLDGNGIVLYQLVNVASR